ncbi:MAG: hypothetical protein IAF00_00405 [Phycisphaerales bacterium]|nr:hypothetical protein [Phycisphaerales bacterium]
MPCTLHFKHGFTVADNADNNAASFTICPTPPLALERSSPGLNARYGPKPSEATSRTDRAAV